MRVLSAFAMSAVLVCGVAACNRNAAREIGLDVAAMDTNAQPGNDFYGYANGTWQRTTEIPGDRSSIGSFYRASLETERQTTELVNDIVQSNPAAGTNEARIANFYNAYTNTAAIDAADMAPTQADLARFNAIANKADLSRVLGEQIRADVDPLNATNYNTENLFGIFVTQGLATPGEVLPYILQGGLGLPEREYYLSNDASMVEIRGQYRAYIEQLLTAAGITDARTKAQRIYDLEVQIARAHMTREQSEDMAARGDARRAPNWRSARRASTGTHSSPPRSSAISNASRPIMRKRSRGFRRLSLQRRCNRGRIGWHSTRSIRTPTFYRQRSTKRISVSTAPPFPARRSSVTAPSVGSMRLTSLSVTPSAKPTSSATSQLPRAKKCKAWSRTSRPLSPHASKGSTGWQSKRAPKRSERLRRSLLALAIRTRGATIRTTKFPPATLTPTPSTASAPSMRTSSPSLVVRWIATNGG